MKRLNNPQKVGGIAMLVVAVSAFLPWVSIFGISVSGIRGDGVITLMCAVVGLAVLGLRATNVGRRISRKLVLAVSGIVAFITALVGLVDMNGAAAIGLYLTMFAGIAWVAAVIWDARTPQIV